MSAMTPAAKMVASTRTSITGRLRDVFRNQRGAVDLPSIMVGAIVLGLLTAAILATVFTVIPWAQDNAAKQKVSQIVASQSVYYAMSTDSGVADPHYGSLPQLVGKKLVTGTNTTASTNFTPAPGTTYDAALADAKIKMVVVNATSASAGTDGFTVDVRSDTGNVFIATHDNPTPRTGTF